MKQWIRQQYSAVRHDWRRLSVVAVGGMLGVIIIAQFLYPSHQLLPFTVIDGMSVGGWQKADATKELDSAYVNKTVPIYFGIAKKPYRSPRLADIGLKVSNNARVQAITYPWYLRLVPTSILWAHNITQRTGEPTYTRSSTTLMSYIAKELGDSCNVKPEDASLKVSGNRFVVVPSHPGGTCEVVTVQQKLSSTKPQLTSDSRVTIPVKEIAASVSDSIAKQLGDQIVAKVGSGVTVKAGDTTKQVAAKDVLSWMDFQTTDGRLTYTFNTDRAAAYLTKTFGPSVAVAAGTTTVNTYDFVETSREVGPSGQQLDVAGTLAQMKAYIDGASTDVTAVTSPVSPTIVYNRSYSPTDQGLSALMANFAQAHSGSFGVSMIELDGQHRRASYNDTTQFTTASTYKLFVAYSTLKRVEAGAWHWSDQIDSGRNLTTCFNDMIEKSDNACAEALLNKIGHAEITSDAHDVGCTSTSFMGNDGIKSTPADEALLLAELQTGQILTQQSSRDVWINAMKQNIYRQGIPAGVKNATVADKVGFLDALLHDAAIVYSPSGTYILVIMTNGSSWGTIADLASQLEALRTQ